MSKPIQVEVYDQVYQLAGSADPEQVRQIAARVDTLMRTIAHQGRVVDTVRLAVLTALNLADENEELRRKCARLEQTLAEKSSEYHRTLDGALSRVG